MVNRRLGSVAIVLCVTPALVAGGCRGKQSAGESKPSVASATASASAIVARLKALPGSPLAAGMAVGFDAAPGGLKPNFLAADMATEKRPARVRLPAAAAAALHLEDAASGVGVDVSTAGAATAPAQSADGYVVYPNALGPGTSMLHRALPGGTEDFVAMDARPATPQITYDLALGDGVAGLRLVAGTLEVLDSRGAPRLHVAPPYIVGADGVSTSAALAVAGCAVDTDPAAPWDRPVTAPGARHCTVRVNWPSGAVAYPAVLDPRWTTTGSMTTARQDHTMTLLATGKVLVAGG
ncbi:MAG TPA: hypothetical protein VIF57_05675, partial [Polyangia bacterium]